MTALLDVSADMALAHAIALLEEATEALAAIEVPALTGIELGEQLLRLRRASRQVEAVTAATTVKFARGYEWEGDGARTPVSWLQGRGNDSPGITRGLFERGALLEAFPSVSAAWSRGAISPQHIDALRTIQRTYPRLRDALIAVDADIATVAVSCAPTDFFQQLKALCHRFDPDAVADDEHDQRQLSQLHVSTHLDGWVSVDGNLEPILGARFLAALESARRKPAVESAEPRDPHADAAAADPFGHLSGAPAAADRRPLSQRNADALSVLLDAAVSAAGADALPRITGERPTINVTVPVEALMSEGSPEAAWLERFGIPTTLISGQAARELACDASLRPLLVDRHGRLIAMMPQVRVLHRALRRAVFMRDVHCRFPHCRQRIEHVHHIVFHSRGGPTVLSNLIGLCGHHHRRIHDSAWHLDGDPGGRVTFTSGMGVEMTSDPPWLRPPDGSRDPFGGGEP